MGVFELCGCFDLLHMGRKSTGRGPFADLTGVLADYTEVKEYICELF